jgi:hypothetical protein
MSLTKEPSSMDPKASATEARKPKPANAAEQKATPKLFAFTIDASDGHVVTLERVDAVGARHDLSPEERASLAKTEAGETVKRLVEQAFEAGIECVLGEDVEKDPEESKDDGELSRMLLQSLMERSSAKRLTESEILNRAIVGTLIRHAAKPEKTATH